MTEERKENKVQALRNLEYYGLQEKLDSLYQHSLTNQHFKNLMSIIKSEDNMMLAYRNIKSNKGSMTPAVDKKTIKDIEILSKDQFLSRMNQEFKHYNPRMVRRKEIPKPNGKSRPLGIPSIWDRIVQQCILQVLEPICEAKFINDSYGFRPNRSAENAIAKAENHINKTKLHYVVDVDIKGFFDEVCHTKLMRQLWTLGIQDKQLLVIIRKILKAPIQMQNGEVLYPSKGTPQGGILSPLLANINLNEFDHWIVNQWAERDLTTIKPYIDPRYHIRSSSHEHFALKKTKLKPMYIVRYADDFKIFTNNRSNANKIFKAVTLWLDERLKLPISLEKSKVTNLKKEYSEFLGFKLKARKKGNRRVAEAHISDKALKTLQCKLKKQVKTIQKTGNSIKTIYEINKYNSMVIGVHNYYKIANQVNDDLVQIAWGLNISMYNRFIKAKVGDVTTNGFTRHGQYNGKDKGILEYLAHEHQSMRYYLKRPILPIEDIKSRNPLQKRRAVNKYTVEGRKFIHKMLSGITQAELAFLRNVPLGWSKGNRSDL